MIDRVILKLFWLTPLKSQRGMRNLLDVFRDHPAFTPTHWSPNDQRQLPPYEENEAIRGVMERKSSMAQGVFKRNKNPKYEAFLFVSNDEFSTIQLKFGKLAQDAKCQALYAFGSALACRVEPEFGFVHPIWDLGAKSQNYSVAGRVKIEEIEDYGLRSLCARTWLGSSLVDRLDKAIAKCGLTQKGVAKNVVEIDLVDKPWQANFATLSARREEVMSVLTKTGLFGDYSDYVKGYKKAKKWVPLRKASP
jgi:hypothetical protein